MATQLPTRTAGIVIRNDQFGGGLTGSFLLHGAVVALLIGWAYLFHGENWGNSNATAGAIPATMVDALPLPPKQPTDQNNVLATENPSPAPVPPAPHTVEAPKLNAIPIPAKPTKPAKLAQKSTPPPPPHPQITKPETNQAPAGEAPGVRIAMSSAQTRAGTVSIGTQDAAFGSRFPWYVEQVTQQVAQQWYTAMLDPQAYGRRVFITFQISRDGSVSDIRIAQPSGDGTLDQTALNAVRRVSNFAPLPDAYTGSYLNVTYYFDPPPLH